MTRTQSREPSACKVAGGVNTCEPEFGTLEAVCVQVPVVGSNHPTSAGPASDDMSTTRSCGTGKYEITRLPSDARAVVT
jgi:hypothetical protein